MPFNGKKTVPRALRKDLWAPLALIQFPEGAGSIGLAAFQKLREYRRLHELSWDDSLLTDDDGKILTRKERGRKISDQKANSVADIASVLAKIGTPEGEKIGLKLKAEGEEGVKVPTVEVKWSDLMDAQFAETWSENVIHDKLEAWNNNRLPSSERAKLAEEERMKDPKVLAQLERQKKREEERAKQEEEKRLQEEEKERIKAEKHKLHLATKAEKHAKYLADRGITEAEYQVELQELLRAKAERQAAKLAKQAAAEAEKEQAKVESQQTQTESEQLKAEREQAEKERLEKEKAEKQALYFATKAEKHAKYLAERGITEEQHLQEVQELLKAKAERQKAKRIAARQRKQQMKQSKESEKSEQSEN